MSFDRPQTGAGLNLGEEDNDDGFESFSSPPAASGKPPAAVPDSEVTPLVPISRPGINSEDVSSDMRRMQIGWWENFWKFKFLAPKIEPASYVLAPGNANKLAARERNLASINKWGTGFGGIFFGAVNTFLIVGLHHRNLYSDTNMYKQLHYRTNMVGDSLLGGASFAVTGLASILPAMLGAGIGYRFNNLERFGAIAGYLTGYGLNAWAMYHFLFPHSANNNPESAITYDEFLSVIDAANLQSKIVLETDETNRNYTISSITFTGANRESVIVISPTATISQNGTHFNITFHSDYLEVSFNNSQTITLQYPNPQTIVPPVRDVNVETVVGLPKNNSTAAPTDILTAQIHGLDTAARPTPGIVDWQTVFANTTTIDNANKVIIGPLKTNPDGSFSLYNYTDVLRYHEVLKGNLKTDVPVVLYTSGFGPGTGFDWSMGANNETAAAIHNNTVAMLNVSQADGFLFDAENQWNIPNPTPVNGTDAANILAVQSLVGGKQIYFTLPAAYAQQLWPVDSLKQAAATGAEGLHMGYRTLQVGQPAAFSADLGLMTNTSDYYKSGLGSRPNVVLSGATQVVIVNATLPYSPYIPANAEVTGFAPGQYPTVAESLYSNECLLTGDCADGNPLGAGMVVIPPQSAESAQAFMIDRDHNYFGTGEMVEGGPNGFNTMAQAAAWAQKKGISVVMSNRFWDQNNTLTKAISDQYPHSPSPSASATTKPSHTPTHTPTGTPTPTANHTRAERAVGFDTGRKPLGLGAEMPSSLPSVEEVVSTVSYAYLSSAATTLARNILKDLYKAAKKDAAAKAAGKPEEECNALADNLFMLANVSLTLLPVIFSSSSVIDAQSRFLSLAMVAAISFGLTVFNKFPNVLNGILAGSAPIAMKTLDNLITGNQSLMKDLILMFSALLISTGGALLVEKAYEPGKALIVKGIGMFARSSSTDRAPRDVRPEPVLDQQRGFAAV